MGHGWVLHAIVCSDDPRHGTPPFAGAGLLHVRVCMSDPPPHVTVQVVLLNQTLQLPLIGHGCVLHATVCSPLPAQLAPPLAGAGLVHVCVCMSVPPPHVAEQAVLLAHSLQLPSTALRCMLEAISRDQQLYRQLRQHTRGNGALMCVARHCLLVAACAVGAAIVWCGVGASTRLRKCSAGACDCARGAVGPGAPVAVNGARLRVACNCLL
jgi:hypothetical protein